MLVDAFIRGRLIAPNDGYTQNLPLRVLAARALRSGDLPLWNPFSFSGFPLLAEAQVATLYPPNLLFVLLPAALANNLLVVASFSVAALGAFLFARHLVGDLVGAIVAGLAFGLCGFFFGHVGHQNMIASVAWLPWVLLAYERLRDRPTPLRLAVAGLALAASLLAGHPQMFFLVILILGVYAFVLATQQRGVRCFVPLLAAFAVVVAGTGLAAVQLLPTVEMANEAAHSQLSYADATSFSYSLSHLPLVLSPTSSATSFRPGRLRPCSQANGR